MLFERLYACISILVIKPGDSKKKVNNTINWGKFSCFLGYQPCKEFALQLFCNSICREGLQRKLTDRHSAG
jgi:hypothetical protein